MHNTNPESIMHILRDCEGAADLWNKVIDAVNWSKYFSLGLVPWLEWNLSSPDIGNTSWNWMSFFAVTVAALWRERNSLVFAK